MVLRFSLEFRFISSWLCCDDVLLVMDLMELSFLIWLMCILVESVISVSVVLVVLKIRLLGCGFVDEVVGVMGVVFEMMFGVGDFVIGLFFFGFGLVLVVNSIVVLCLVLSIFIVLWVYLGSLRVLVVRFVIVGEFFILILMNCFIFSLLVVFLMNSRFCVLI